MRILIAIFTLVPIILFGCNLESSDKNSYQESQVADPDSLRIYFSQISSLEKTNSFNDILLKAEQAKVHVSTKEDLSKLHLKKFHAYMNLSKFDAARYLIPNMYSGDNKKLWTEYSWCYYYARSGQYLEAIKSGNEFKQNSKGKNIASNMKQDISQYLCISYLALDRISDLKNEINLLPERMLGITVNYKNEIVAYRQLKMLLENP